MRQIVLVGDFQVHAVAGLYKRFVAPRTGDRLTYVPFHKRGDPAAQLAIRQADLLVQQVDRAPVNAIGAACPVVPIPRVTAEFLWPFAGEPHPRNTRFPFLPSGPYGGEAGDRYLNTLIAEGVAPEDALQRYLDLDVPREADLDALFEASMVQQRARDAASGYRIADAIEAHFRREPVFLSPTHPNARIMRALAEHLFARMGAQSADIARMAQATARSPMPREQLPVHPAVARHFGLRWAGPAQRYRLLNDGDFTFREFVLRYMRHEWNAALEEGLAMSRTDDQAEAEVMLSDGLRRSPGSAEGHNALRHVLERQARLQEAIAAGQRAASVDPDFPTYQVELANVLRRAGRAEEAEQAYREALAVDPADAHAMAFLAHLLLQQKRHDEAATVVLQALEVEPYSAQLKAMLAEVVGGPLRSRSGQVSEALPDSTDADFLRFRGGMAKLVAISVPSIPPCNCDIRDGYASGIDDNTRTNSNVRRIATLTDTPVPETSRVPTKPAAWPYRSDPPQRYWSNYGRYIQRGGLVDLEKDIAGFVAGGNVGDISRFYFFCLVLDQIRKEGLAGDLAELGVYRGNTASLIAGIARRLGRTAYLLDTFEGFSEADLRGIDVHQKMQFADTSLDAVRKAVGEENVRYVQGHFPETARELPDTSYCLVHIDCDLYAPIYSALEYFYPRLVPGGYLIIHDYSSLAWDGAERAVDEFFADKPEPIIPLTDGAGSVVVRRARRPGAQHGWLGQKRLDWTSGDWVPAGRGRLSDDLIEGWGGQEEWGVWGVGPRHELKLFMPPHQQSDLVLDIDVHAPLIGSNEDHQVNVSIEGRNVTTLSFTNAGNRGVRSIRIPWDIVPTGELPSIAVVFSPRRTVRPADFNPTGGDVRELGLALHRIRLRAA